MIAIALALLFHLGVLSLPWQRWFQTERPRDEIVPVQVLDPAAIARMREQNRQLLLENRSAPESTEAPENARFESDRNVRVEREQRARQGEVLPQAAAQNTRTKPDLSRFGVKLGARPAARAETHRAPSQQLVDDPTLPLGAENMLSSAQSVYYSFYARLAEGTLPIWQSSVRTLESQGLTLPAGDFVTVVELVLREDGALEDIRTLQSSGYSQLDRAAEDSWRRLTRYPNPPRALLGPDGRLRVRWGYKVTNQPGSFRVLPPVRID